MAVVAASWDGRSAPRLAITRTAVWNGLAATPHLLWAMRRAEMTAFATSPFRAPTGARATMAQIRSLPPRADLGARLRVMVKRLVGELLGPVAPELGRARLGVSLVLPERMSDEIRDRRQKRQRRDVEQEVTDVVRALGLEPIVEVITRGHAGGAFGALQAGHALASGTLDLALIGGVDSYYDPPVMQALGEEQRLFDGEHTDGIIPGEGAAFLLVARHDVARRMRWPALGYLLGAAVEEEIGHSLSEVPCMGLGLSRAAVAATEPLRAAGQRLDWWITDLTPEEDRVHEFQLAFPRTTAGIMSAGSSLEHLPTNLGDIGAATIPTAAVVALEGMRRQSPAAASCLLTGSSLGPSRGAMLVVTA
jgi:3-oxoacyl-[acyl-carrier-protein] synthase-1